MHKKIPVLDIAIDEETGNIAKILATHDIGHLPVGVRVNATGLDRKALNLWWADRSIPFSRDGLKQVLNTLGIINTTVLLLKSNALSLSDHYWMRPDNSGLHWETVNFFQNDFPKDMGEILFGREPKEAAQTNLMSPDNTTDGWLRKKWIIKDGKRYLKKGSSGLLKQEPYNEVAACAIMRRLHIPHVDYTLAIEDGKPYSLCETFLTPETELVPAWRVRETLKKSNNDSELTHMLRCCETLGIPDVRAALDRMMTLDFIISNEDRHYFNFGFLRDSETLEWLGPAPIYDSGTSLWHNTRQVGVPVLCKPFRSSHAEQLELVENFSWFDQKKLEGLDDEIMELFSTSDDMDEKRRTAISSAVMERCGRIASIA